jgi:hypothetical protein
MVGMLRAEVLVDNAKVRKEIAQEEAIEQAVLLFESRFGALPGDYDRASVFIDCGITPCLNGNGNGRVDAGGAGSMHEDILAWAHLSAAGLLEERYELVDASEALPRPTNTPRNAFGGFLQLAFDSNWGCCTTPEPRHNIKTGNYVPSGVLAEMDSKIDDGRPTSGRLQFSSYAGSGSSASVQAATSGCIEVGGPGGRWLPASGSDNCGAALLLR